MTSVEQSQPDPFDQVEPLSPVEVAIVNRVPWTPVDPNTAGVVIDYGDPDAGPL